MHLHPTLSLTRPAGELLGEASVAARVQVVLETRPGSVPWEPEFGCPLDDLVGAPATSQRLSEMRWRIQSALARWLPEAKIARCEVAAVRVTAGEGARTWAVAAPAEAALLSLGAHVALEVEMDIETEHGIVGVAATLNPRRGA